MLHRFDLFDGIVIVISAVLAIVCAVIYIIVARSKPRRERDEFIFAGLTLGLIFIIVYRLVTRLG